MIDQGLFQAIVLMALGFILAGLELYATNDAVVPLLTAVLCLALGGWIFTGWAVAAMIRMLP